MTTMTPDQLRGIAEQATAKMHECYEASSSADWDYGKRSRQGEHHRELAAAFWAIADAATEAVKIMDKAKDIDWSDAAKTPWWLR